MEELSADPGQQTPVGNVQVDAFCSHCNYNLFSQVVSRDERLGILVCRCPECGRFSAAGNMSTANQRLAQRLATGGLVVYIGFILCIFAIASGTLVGTQGSYLDDRFYIEFQPGNHGPIVTWPDLLGAAIAGTSLGGFFATFCWHWRRGLRYLAALAPIPLAALAWTVWDRPSYYAPNRPSFAPWGLRVLGLIVALQIASILIGEWLGRPIARLSLRVLLPARLLQYLGFLWFVDGKVPPAPRMFSAPSSV